MERRTNWPPSPPPSLLPAATTYFAIHLNYTSMSIRSITVLLILVFQFSASIAEEVSFQRQVRGILSDKCFQCHGPDAADRQAGLRLDEEASAKSELDSGETAIVPGNIDASVLIERILTQDPDTRMPPEHSGKSLTETEIQILKQWISEGATWGQHWSFVPINRSQLPKTGDQTNIVNDIDRFIRARLPEQDLRHSSEADRVSLIRRVTFDLTGLPPTVAEVDAFLADGSPDAYKKIVERLLASPHYGEHMARFWLDIARYGDTHGLHLDNYREMWPYRDWVINAFNNNKPFNDFTVEQLAGDLLDHPTDEQLIATGFNRCHVTTSEGGSIAEEVHVRNVVDRVVTTGTAFMGLTMDCTRCHDHKFDPLTMKDFYSFYAYFNSIDGPPLDGNKKDPAPMMRVMTDQQKQEVAILKQKQRDAKADLKKFLASVTYLEPQNPAPRILPEPVEFVWVEDAIPEGAKPSGDSPWEFQESPAPVFSGTKSHTRTANELSQHLFTAATKPLTVANQDTFFCYVFLDPKNPPKEIMLQWNDGNWNHRAYWGGDKIDWGKNDSPSRRNYGPLPKTGEWVRLEVPADDVGFKKGSKVNGWAFTQFGGTVHWDKAGIVSKSKQSPLYDSFVSWENDQKETKAATLPENLKPLVGNTDRSQADTTQLQAYFFEHAWTETNAEVKKIKSREAAAKQREQQIVSSVPTTLVFKESKEPKPAYLLNRGEYDQKGEQVGRAIPAVLPAMPENTPQNRLGVARWLVSDSHPLTARVTVNRIWQQFFGNGLVKTSEDFGSQGEQPSHPLLLDWLASEFMQPKLSGAQHNWDVNHLVRLIVMSSTYRQTAQVLPTAYQIDPENRYLSRGPRFRLDAEMLRDQALAVSGLLIDDVGGPSVKPPQPDGLWFAVGFTGSDTARFKKDNGKQKVHRRTLYTFLKRTAPAPQMSTFDAPSRESCVVRRERTNSPMQALLMMNDPQYVECARGLAERAIRQAGTTELQKAKFILRRCVLRSPQQTEVENLVADYRYYLAEYQANPEAAASLIAIGEEASDTAIPATELAAWTVVANLVLNLDEVINK